LQSPHPAPNQKMSQAFALGMRGVGRRGFATSVRKLASTALAEKEAFAPVSKIGGPAAWTKDELVAGKWWGYELSPSLLTELDDALENAKSSNIEWEGDVPLNVSQGNFPLRKMAETIAEMSDELENGSGAAMLANLPVHKYSVEELSVIYLGICSYIGNVVQQSSAGLRSKSRGYGMPLGHVKAEMRGKTPLDGKQSNNYFRLHTDRCDMISLLSVRTASQGGHGRVASAVAIHDAMVERAPDLVPLLYSPIERIWEGGEGVIALPIWAFEETSGKFTTQISPSYIENAQYVNGVRKLTAGEIEAIDLIEEIGLEIGHNFLQLPGQLTFMNNHLVYHGRTAWKYADIDDAENARDNVENGRLLLRAWLSPYNSRPLPDTPEFNEMWGDVAPGVPRGGLEPAIKAGIKAKPPELVEAYTSGKADYYGLYKRKFEGEDVSF